MAQLPIDDNNKPAVGGYDSTGHQVVALQAVSVTTDATTGIKYGVLNSNASFSASSVGINDGTIASQKLKVNVDGSINDNLTQVAGVAVPTGSSGLLPSMITTPAMLAMSPAVYATVDPQGELRVAEEPVQSFSDGFDSGLDTINKWKSPTSGGGGVAATNVPTSTQLGTGTTANGYSHLESVYAFPPKNPGWLQITFGNNIPVPYVANTYFFWGLGFSPATPTAAIPISDGAGWEYVNGKLYAVMYQGNTRNQIADLSAATGNNKQPTDANVHYYTMYYRGDRTYWSIDNLDNLVASTTTGAPGPNFNTLPLKMAAIAGTSAPASSSLLTCNTVWVGDTTRGHMQIADGVYPWRKASVDAVGNMSINVGKVGGVATQMAGSDNVSTANFPMTVIGMHNGTTIDQVRGNIDNRNIILANNVSTLQFSIDQINFSGHGAKVWLNVSAIGTGSLILTIQGRDPFSGNYFTLLTSTAITTNGFYMFTIFPGIAPVANLQVSDVIPRAWKVQVSGAAASSFAVNVSVMI